MAATPQRRTTRRAARPPKGPSEFVSGVYVGGWKEAQGFSGSRFCVLDEVPDGMPPATHIPIYDGAKDRPIVRNLDRLTDRMKQAHDRGEPVVVFCGHGVRRSPLAAAWYLHRTEGVALEEAYARVRTVRPGIEVAREWIGDVSELA